MFLDGHAMDAGESRPQLLRHDLTGLAVGWIAEQSARDRFSFDPLHEEKRHAEAVIAKEVRFRDQHAFRIDSFDHPVLKAPLHHRLWSFLRITAEHERQCDDLTISLLNDGVKRPGLARGASRQQAESCDPHLLNLARMRGSFDELCQEGSELFWCRGAGFGYGTHGSKGNIGSFFI